MWSSKFYIFLMAFDGNYSTPSNSNTIHTGIATKMATKAKIIRRKKPSKIPVPADAFFDIIIYSLLQCTIIIVKMVIMAHGYSIKGSVLHVFYNKS